MGVSIRRLQQKTQGNIGGGRNRGGAVESPSSVGFPSRDATSRQHLVHASILWWDKLGRGAWLQFRFRYTAEPPQTRVEMAVGMMAKRESFGLLGERRWRKKRWRLIGCRGHHPSGGGHRYAILISYNAFLSCKSSSSSSREALEP